ncbi:imidazole glycerol phosphate synthase subunit HisF [Leuconostoc lactis]|uniref:imidazole glycerol phosphate synthase subunit HisF n=1 Tax=Leuconostoc lactis TaxID=1246 RepID=UPI0015F47549|nr:imidazole glycerol phosphate synthase subunit HisF [Leuconostoc lactis]MBA5812899.1 imidazole glycerol phosphate synthase subunit HisF [Leuconostoc lactis]MDI6496725.1 imidazole glycerol phosphate synthase subunit HisF [Leuconostoc lactis]
MTLAKRIIPALDVKNGRVVKGIQFKQLQDVGDPVTSATAYQDAGADELVFLDISATQEGRATMIEVIERVSAAVFIPLMAGGGVTDLASMKAIIQAGADKVFLNSAAVDNPALITAGAALYGSQAIVGAIDTKWDDVAKMYRVYTAGGTRPTALNALDWAETMVAHGVGELLVTSMSADGTKKGYDIALYQALQARVKVPIIASGGAGSQQDFTAVFQDGAVDGALAASVFHYGEMRLPELKMHLYEKGIPIRL